MRLWYYLITRETASIFLDRNGFHVEEFVYFWNFVKIRRMA